MFKIIKWIIKIAIMAAVVLGIVAVISQVAVAPAPERVEKYLEKTENVSVSIVEEKSLLLASEVFFEIDDLTCQVNVYDSEDSESMVIFYFEDFKDTREAYRTLMKKYDDQDNVKVTIRGKSVIVGSDDLIKLYRMKVIF
ncbi:MAG TPA: hypothetical protein P5161_05465 [Eubacteriales bacterium]|nr:hypothetical protein [Clostridia bacterium]HRR90207.1 hypothetical protein [Eubacteriales bacterium]HRU84418.1 hypothetical protein [Eubacteriales bacterium]